MKPLVSRLLLPLPLLPCTLLAAWGQPSLPPAEGVDSTTPAATTPQTTLLKEPQDIPSLKKREIITAKIESLRDPCILYENGVYYAFDTGWVAYMNRNGALDSMWFPLGCVAEISDGQITPHDWDAIDGTLYVDPTDSRE